jgi:hypothetical protein
MDNLLTPTSKIDNLNDLLNKPGFFGDSPETAVVEGIISSIYYDGENNIYYLKNSLGQVLGYKYFILSAYIGFKPFKTAEDLIAAFNWKLGDEIILKTKKEPETITHYIFSGYREKSDQIILSGFTFTTSSLFKQFLWEKDYSWITIGKLEQEEEAND